MAYLIRAQWDVIRTTSDKLQDTLNDITNGSGWTVHMIQHVGGRDWIVIALNTNGL